MGNSPEICRRHYAALVPHSLVPDVEFGKFRPQHFETLLQWESMGDHRYYLLIRFGHDLTDDDYSAAQRSAD